MLGVVVGEKVAVEESGEGELYGRRRPADIHLLFTCCHIVTLHFT